jgi:pyruvate dehydrogenase E2 component (dihydrolipoamide acetyltransferase)
VVSEAGVSDGEVDSFVADFLASFKPPEKGASSGPTAAVIDAGGRRIRHLRLGPDSGVPIVLLHGFGADMGTWMFNQDALAEDRPVYVVDLPGHGGSGKELGGGSVDTLAEAIVDYMDAAGIGAAHLVGHSLGGAIAMTVALKEPDRVAALTLVAPAGLGTEIAGEFIEGFIAESRARKLKPFIEMLVANPDLVTSDMVEEVLKFKRLDGAVAALRAIADANFTGGVQQVSLRDRLGAVRVPVQVIWGEEDRILPAHHAEGLAPAVGVTRLSGAGHIVHMEKAAEVNARVKALG